MRPVHTQRKLHELWVNHQSKAAQLALKFLQTFYYDVEWVEADSKAYRRCVTGALETVRRTACVFRTDPAI